MCFSPVKFHYLCNWTYLRYTVTNYIHFIIHFQWQGTHPSLPPGYPIDTVQPGHPTLQIPYHRMSYHQISRYPTPLPRYIGDDQLEGEWFTSRLAVTFSISNNSYMSHIRLYKFTHTSSVNVRRFMQLHFWFGFVIFGAEMMVFRLV